MFDLKKARIYVVMLISLLAGVSTNAVASDEILSSFIDLIETIEAIEEGETQNTKTCYFVQEANVTMYPFASWENMLFIKRGISLDQAMTIAKNRPSVSFFLE